VKWNAQKAKRPSTKSILPASMVALAAPVTVFTRSAPKLRCTEANQHDAADDRPAVISIRAWLIIVCGLVAIFVIIEKRAPKP
jgi:uncharacterized membrane protein